MLIYWCWLLILVLHSAFSTEPLSESFKNHQICDKYEEESLLAFAEQPDSACLSRQTTHQVTCRPINPVPKAVIVKWKVLENGVVYNTQPDGSLFLTCEKTSCQPRISCSLIHNITSSSYRQILSINSREAVISLGREENCDRNGRNYAVLKQPEPRIRLIRAHQMTNITLPCLVFVDQSLGYNSSISTFWYRNGNPLFPSSNSELIESDGVYSLSRHLKNDFMLWSNLTIYHLHADHAGYYQCFVSSKNSQSCNVIFLEVLANMVPSRDDAVSISISKPAILRVVYKNPAEIRIYFSRARLNFLSKDVSIDQSMGSLEMQLNYSIGAIRQKKHISSDSISDSDYFHCYTSINVSSAETWFGPSHLSTAEETAIDYSLPPSFHADKALCQQFYSYAIFVKYFSNTMHLSSTSALYQLSFDLNSPSDSQNDVSKFDLSIDEVHSEGHYACLISKNEGTLLASDSSRLIAPVQLVKQEHVKLTPYCTCECSSGESSSISSSTPAPRNSSLSFSISLSNVPYSTGGLLPNTSYCFSVDDHCVDYFVPGTPKSELANAVQQQVFPQPAHPLSFERLPDDTIAVSWYLAHCKGRLKRNLNWSVQLHTGENRTKIATVDCSGRVLFKHVTNFRSRHDISLSYGNTDLSVLAVPAILTIENLSAFIITKSRTILSWTVAGFLDDPMENRQATEIGYSIYACLPSTKIPDFGVMDRRVLECLGCRYICRVAAYSITSNDVMHAELAGYDEHVAEFQFVVWADVSLLVDSGKDYETMQDSDTVQIHEMVPIGVVGRINVSLSDKEIDRHRPIEVSLAVNSSHSSDWTISWSPPPSPRDSLTLVSYTIQIAPISQYLLGEIDFDSPHILIRIVQANDTSISIDQSSNELFIAEDSLDDEKNHQICPPSKPHAFVVQVTPVWAWEHRHKSGNNSFIIDGAPSIPFVYEPISDNSSLPGDESSQTRLRERALAYEELIKSLGGVEEDSSTQRTGSYETNANVASSIPSLLPVPIVIACVSFLCVLLVAMFLVYRCQVRNDAAKYQPGSIGSGTSEITDHNNQNADSPVPQAAILKSSRAPHIQDEASPPLLSTVHCVDS